MSASHSAGSYACPRPVSQTIPALLAEIASRYPSNEALVFASERYSYAELHHKVRACAKGLIALGVRPKDRVAILMGNRTEWIIASLAVCSLGAVMIAVNTWLTTRELLYVLEHSDCDTLVFAPRFLRSDYEAMLTEIRAMDGTVPLLKRFISVDETAMTDSVRFCDLERIGQRITDEALQRAAGAVVADDIAYLLYTSGSTATPKGVQLQHGSLVSNTWSIGERMNVTDRDRLWLAVSLFWGFGCENALLNMLTHGACVVLQEHFDAAEALRLIAAERCTLIYATPNIIGALHDHPERHGHDLTSLRSGGSFGAPDQMERAIELGARDICHIYGLTEVYGNCHVSDCRFDPPDRRLVCVGRPLPGFTQRIADPETLAPLPSGEVGEIQVKGHVTPGYYKDPERTQQAFTPDGFFRTGDLGFIDEQGFLFFRGRLKELIKTGGINVSPAEIEEVIMQHPAVHQAYVVGIPDTKKDEIIGAVIVSNRVDEQELIALCKSNLAPYKVPRHYRFVSESELPMTSTRKVQRNRLVDLFL